MHQSGLGSDVLAYNSKDSIKKTMNLFIIVKEDCRSINMRSKHLFFFCMTPSRRFVIPPGENKTTIMIFEPNLKQIILNSGQVRTWDSQSTVLNFISQGLIKAKRTRLYTSCLCRIRVKHTS